MPELPAGEGTLLMTDTPISAVVFDVGKVLFEWDLRHLYRKLIAEPAELEWFVTTVVTPEWHYQADEGRAVPEMVAERSAEFPEHAALIQAWADRFNETIPGPVPGSIELVEALATRDVPLFAITNFGDEFWAAFCPTQPVFDLFRNIVVSGTEKLAKPDREIYALAVRRFGHPPETMLFIDDNAANVAAARDCGWQTHHFGDAQTLATDLRERGLIA